MDTGARHDVAPGLRTRGNIVEQIRKLMEESTADTANSAVVVKEGVRVRLGHWDAIIDGTVMDGCDSNLAFVGQRVCYDGFTCIWCRGEFPCFTLPYAKSIITFDIA